MSEENKRFSNEEMFLAESVADYLERHDDLSHSSIGALLEFRKETLCERSENQEYQCSVTTRHGYCCDTCLQSELHNLWSAGIKTAGSCCGHGGKYKPYIQVTDPYVQKMHELGYKQIPNDENGNGKNAFVPKTKLIKEPQEEIIGLLDEMEESRWIPCAEQMPPERETIFAKFRGTDKWKPAMFERMSEDVRIVAEYPDGYRRVHHSYTVDGQWEIERKKAPSARAKVLFWMKNPKLPKEEK